MVTRSVKWRIESTSLHSEQGTQELTDAFRSLVSEERLIGAKVQLALSGELCVTRVVSGTTELVRRETNEIEERSHLYLSLGPGEKTIAKSVRQLDARHQHALLSVCNQKTLDVLNRVADEVGIHITTIEPSLVALARVQGRLKQRSDDAALIIQTDEFGAEIGICHEGQLLLDYRPAGRAASDNIAEVVSEHLTRLERFLQRNHAPTKSSLREVYLTGETAWVERARAQFAAHEKLQVHVLDPSELDVGWQHAGDPAGTELAAAVGTALLMDGDDADQPGPNLLEHHLAQNREPIRPVLVRSAIPLAATLLLAAGIWVWNLHEGGIVRGMQAELEALAPVRLEANTLRLKLESTSKLGKQLRAMETRLGQPDWTVVLTRFGQCMPDEVWLDRLSIVDAQTGTLTGASYTDSGVYDFVKYLKQVPGVGQAAIQSTGIGQTSGGPTTSFDVEFALAGYSVRSEGRSDHD